MPDQMPQDINPSNARFRWEPNALVHRSPESGAEHRIDIWGRWHATFVYDLAGDDLLDMLAFLESVQLSTPFYVLHPLRRQPRAVWAHASGLVKGADQTGTSLISDGWPINTNPLFLAGDIIELVDTAQCVRIKTDAQSDGSGDATLALAQAIRSSPGDNTEIRVVNPRFTMVLNAPVEDVIDDSSFSSFTIEMREDV